MTADLVERAETLPAVEAEPQRGSMLTIIARAASDPNVDVAKMQALLDMQRQIMAEQARAEFNEAFARLSAGLPRIKKTGVLEYPVDKNKPQGEKYKVSNFAKWEEIDKGIRLLLNAEGFALSFDAQPRPMEGGGLIVTANLMHTAGHSRSASIPVPLDTSGGKNNLQAYGSTLSYGKRYAACAVLNIVTEDEDDDGAFGGLEFIDADKVAKIEKLLRVTNSDRTRFFAFVKGDSNMTVEKVEDITVSAFPRAIAQLERKQREQAVGKR